MLPIQRRRLGGSPAERHKSSSVELPRVRGPLDSSEYHPTLVFLAETKCSSRQIDALKRRFDMNGLCVDSRGRSGGLAIFWNKSVDVMLQTFSHCHIDASVKLGDDQAWWRFTGMYGEPETCKRDSTWRLLSHLHSQSARSWLCAGDFNEILDQSEKLGGPPRPVWQLRNFRQALVDCELSDLGFSGNPFTWSNHHAFPHTVQERLDRACANPGWTQFFPNASVTHIPWSRQCFRHDKQRVSKLEKRLATILSGTLTQDLKEEASSIRKELESTAAHAETVWRQRREWVEKPDDIQQHIISYFRDVFASSHPRGNDIANGIEHLRSLVDASMAEDLLQPYTETEVTAALFQMAPLKSPGPNGMSPIFFQKFWNIIKGDVSACVLSLLNSFLMPPGLNDTNIVLIPKCKHPEHLTQLRPISLCNVVYKIASKTIANRLKGLLDRIISPTQSNFVPGRLITDNVLLAFELNHFLNTKAKGGQGYIALKLDVSKAYDKVERIFLEQVLFKTWHPPPSRFIRLVMLCVSSVSYSFMLGGRQFGTLIPERGLRQGDPLSPYMFLLCTEAFSSILQRAEADGRIRGVSICRGTPHISHLLFVDDTLIFCQASLEGSRAIKEVLETYRRASGQEINSNKSSVAFSRNTRDDLCSQIGADLNIRRENKMELYLGLPSKIARSKKELFSIIRDRIWKRITGWNEKLLSQAGKELLIKSIVQAIPTYAMSCFRLPVTLLKEIHGMIATFWWGSRGRNRIHWISWQRLCESKLQGGLGFRQLYLFNLAMLAKQLWRIFCSPNRLFGRVLRARYFPHGDIFAATVGRNPSFTWRSIMAAHKLFRAGYNWRVGNGGSIRVWADPWVPRPVSFRPVTPRLQEVFLDIDSEVILEIPLSRLGAEDLIIWRYSPNGLFSVRSTYHLACSLETRPSASHVRETEHRWWRRLWQTALPCKVKSVLSWMFAVTSQLEKQEIEYFLCICWALWWCRNTKLAESNYLVPDQVIYFVGRYLESFRSQFLNTSIPLPRARSLRWQGPPPNYVKLNFDGAILNHGTDTGIGIVARDECGTCVGWAAIRVPMRSSGELAEALAAREAVQLALRRGWQYVIVEGDCSSLISKLLSSLKDLSPSGPINVDIIKLVSNFRSCSFQLINCTCNLVAHRLAKSALGFAEGISDIPVSVALFVALDAIVA
ncbi:UNVERIFIED_CONTAM: putative mitochondrial protein [Sesamum radiatum]|uniref:Mitochondrial protein n=1 Tax=Sesamum radiatum TaxID=300843 RepID=A0AAW2KIC4_SESRA